MQNARTQSPEATSESLSRGRELFISRCQRCHHLPDRRAYSEQGWPKILDKMAPRAKLDPVEHQLVLQFILAERKG